MHIRQATQQDIHLIQDILLDARNFMQSINMPQWSERDITWECLSLHFKIDDFHIAYIDEQPAGCMAVIDHDPIIWPDVPKGESLFIHKFAVKRFAAGKGVSTAMIDYVKSLCKQRGISSIRLDSHKYRPKVHAVYRRAGFKLVGETFIVGKFLSVLYKWDAQDA